VQTAVYVRLSEDKTGEALGITRQREDADRLAAARGWPVDSVDYYVDNSVSATSGETRDAWERMMREIEAGRVQVVIGWTIDRVLRSGKDRLRMLDAGREHGITIALTRGSDMDLSTPSGRLAADILGAVAQNEVEQKSDRQRRAAEQVAALGRPPAGPVPFGFLPDRTTHHPAQAAAIRAAYDSLLAGGSLAAIALAWNDAGLTSGRVRTGVIDTGEPSKWRAETVRAVLLKPRNAGLRSYLGETVGEATWEPLVPLATFQAAVALLNDPSRRQAAPSTRGHLLSGLARCGTCGAPVNAGTRRPEYFAYRCRTAGHVARRGDHVDDYVRAVVVARLSRSDAVDLLQHDTRPDAAELRDRSLVLRARLDSLATDFAEGELTASQLRTATQRIRSQIVQLDAQLADLGKINVLGGLAGVPNVGAIWDEVGLDRQRAVIDALMVVTLHPPGQGARTFDSATIEIKWTTE